MGGGFICFGPLWTELPDYDVICTYHYNHGVYFFSKNEQIDEHGYTISVAAVHSDVKKAEKSVREKERDIVQKLLDAGCDDVVKIHWSDTDNGFVWKYGDSKWCYDIEGAYIGVKNEGRTRTNCERSDKEVENRLQW